MPLSEPTWPISSSRASRSTSAAFTRSRRSPLGRAGLGPRDRRRERRGQVDARADSRRRSLGGRRSAAPGRSADLLPLSSRGARPGRRDDRPGALAGPRADRRRERLSRCRAEKRGLHPTPVAAQGIRGARRPRRVRPARRRSRRHPEHRGPAEDGDPPRTFTRRPDHRHGRAVRSAQRARDGTAARDRPLARRAATDDHPHLALPARGARARRLGDRAP